ncbi:MAG TPA: DoxX family protein [Fimbriimonadaceae bacterium]|nr:DoxX family protein [Fimbriimonadaceae bacterium]
MAVATATQTRDQVASRTTSADWGIFVIRVVLGIIFFAHGGQKVFGWFGGYGLAATIDFMQKGGIPAFLGYVAAFTELLGGLGLIFGVLTRLSALGILVTMLVAMFKVHLANGFFLSMGSAGDGIEYNLALAAMALGLVFTGPGALKIWDPERNLIRF